MDRVVLMAMLPAVVERITLNERERVSSSAA
jgi:hypothetical protein